MTREIKTVYRVSLDNGRFDHVRGKINAYRRAVEMLPPLFGEPTLESDYLYIRDDPARFGVRIERVSAATARAVGL